MGLLQDKRALIIGVANNRSIAWGIAEAMRRQGAELALTYHNGRVRERVAKLAAQLDTDILLPCDVGEDRQIEGVFEHLDDYWDHLDILVHSVAFAPPGQLEGEFLDAVTREGFKIAHEISSYSFTALAKAGRSMFGKAASLITLSNLGAARAVPHYNVMGLAKASLEANVRYLAASLGPDNVRVNAISAGPVKTLSPKGTGDFDKLLDHAQRNSPLRRNVTLEEVGNVAAFLGSEMASGVTGEIIYVDAGYHAMAMAIPENV